jgi:hypothetical protein
MGKNIFVVWDLTTHAIDTTLDALRRRPPPGVSFNVPMLSPAGGEILRDVVVRGIANADQVLVVMDKPNANVGFEAGLALGLGRKIALLVQRAPRPSWLMEPPFTNFIVHSVDGPSAIKALIADGSIWTRRSEAAGDAPNGRDPTLFLCPTRFGGEGMRDEQTSLYPNWSALPEYNFTLHDLPDLCRGVERLIWTVTPYAEGADERDGAANAANAVIAGWFVGEILRRHGDSLDHAAMAELRQRFHVLRSSKAREVVDVQLFERRFTSLPQFAELLRNTPEVPSSAESLQGLRELLLNLTAGSLLDLARATDSSLVDVLSACSRSKESMIDALLGAVSADATLRGPFLEAVEVALPGTTLALARPAAPPAVAQTRQQPVQPSGAVVLTAGSVLGTAHRLDRTTQWGQVLDECSNDSHSLFSLRGESRQGLGLFLQRLNFYLSEKVPGHRVYNVPFRVEHIFAESGPDWEARLSHAIAPRKAGTAAAHLASITRSVSPFFVLGLQPLHDLTPSQEQGLREFLSVTLPDLLLAAEPARPVRVLVPMDYDGGTHVLSDAVDQGALAGEHRHKLEIERLGRTTESARMLHYVSLNPVTFPTWDEVQTYLDTLRPRPALTMIVRIREDFERITTNDNSTFQELAERLDRHLGEI